MQKAKAEPFSPVDAIKLCLWASSGLIFWDQQQGDEHALAWCVQFARLYPLGQRDLPIERKHVDFGPLMPASARIENPSRDYTPPSAHHLLRPPAPLT